MDNASQKLLEAATHRTLHAAGFSRSSSQATLVLTDLLSRYLTLLTSTCSKYAQHSGRTMLSSLDALTALDELGVSLDELKDFGATEGLELNRYSLRSARRVEDLAEFRAQLSEGLKQDEDDVIPLHYAPFDGEDDMQDEEEDEDASGWDDGAPVDEDDLYADMDVSLDDARRPVAPMLPLSPISNPASPPTRKRRRLSDWQPPPHVPDFLPPFPTMEDASSPTDPLPEPVAPMENNRPPSPTQPAVPAQALTSSTGADWHLQVPYHQSSLSSQPEFHLPAPLPAHSPRQPKLPTPATEPALIAAYHHILTHRQETTAMPGNGNPLRHKVAMSLLSLVQASSRWEPSDTLYSNLTTNQPRVTAMGPSHPIALGDTHGAQLTKEKDFKFPAVTSRSVIASEHLTNVVAEQSSRIPDLAQQVLPLKIYNRTSRLAPPPVLIADNKPLTYGNGIPAPWNIGPTPPTAEGKKTDNPRVLPDARLFATWDSETKSFKEPLKGRGSRGKTVIHSSRRTGRNA